MVNQHASAVRRHWYWRPGWHVGTRFYTWHIIFDGQPEVAALAERYREALAGQSTLDTIPTRWLHLTMQGIGFADQITPTRSTRSWRQLEFAV